MVQFKANELYKVYRLFEEEYLGRNPMALSTWGEQFKMLIEQGRAPEWQVHSPSKNRTLFTYRPDNVVALPIAAPKAAG
jgi:hypothetical protein